MEISAAVCCFNVADVSASVDFFVTHLGFEADMQYPGFASLRHTAVAANVVFHEIGLDILPAGFRDERAAGVILALTVADVRAEYERLAAAGADVMLAPTDQEWGERLFLVRDPNGVVVEIMQWLEDAPTPG